MLNLSNYWIVLSILSGLFILFNFINIFKGKGYKTIIILSLMFTCLSVLGMYHNILCHIIIEGYEYAIEFNPDIIVLYTLIISILIILNLISYFLIRMKEKRYE